jgi:hypothetical protein
MNSIQDLDKFYHELHAMFYSCNLCPICNTPIILKWSDTCITENFWCINECFDICGNMLNIFKPIKFYFYIYNPEDTGKDYYCYNGFRNYDNYLKNQIDMSELKDFTLNGIIAYINKVRTFQ